MSRHDSLRTKSLSWVLVLALGLILAGVATAAEIPKPTGDPSVLPPDSRLVPVFTEGFFLEGPAVGLDGCVYFSDITFSFASGMQAGHIWKHDPRTGKTSIFRSPSGMSNGIKFDAKGDMVVAEGADFGGRRITRTDMKTGKAYIVAGLYDGRPFNGPNDIAIDEKGRIYFSDPRYLGHEAVDQPIMGVYRIDADNSVHLIITDAGKPNGVAVSPDQKTLYVVCNNNGTTAQHRLPKDMMPMKGAMALLAYDLAPDGSAKFREKLVDYYPQDGPDGMTCDKEGNLYLAVRDETRPGFYVYTPQGRELAYIPTPDLPTNVAWGRGAEIKTLYCTVGKVLYKIKMAKDGYQLPMR
jgi:gluconolactonase